MDKKQSLLDNLKRKMRIESPLAIKKAAEMFHRKGENNSVSNARKSLRMPIISMAHMTSRGFHITTEVSLRDISIYGIGGHAVCPYQKGETVQVELKLKKSEKEVQV